MEKELVREISKLKEMYENKIDEMRGIPHYEDQDSYDWIVSAYEEVVLDLEQLIERAAGR